MSSPDVPRPDVVRELQASRLIYPFYRKLIERFELEMFPCKDLEEQSAETPEALTRVRLWFAEADKHIEATHIRQLLQDEAMDEPTLRFLIWRHVAKEGKTDSDRFKVDFLLGNYLAQNMPGDLATGEVRVSAVASVLEPVVGESEYLTYVEDLEECVRELRDCKHLQDLLERNILERGKTLKAAAGETFFHQAGLIAFTRFNFLTRRRVVDLLNTDLEEIGKLVGEVQLRGIKAVDCAAAGLNGTESCESLRERIKQWRKPFQGKYSNMEWLQQISNLRKVLKRALEQQTQAEAVAAAEAPVPESVPAAQPEEEAAEVTPDTAIQSAGEELAAPVPVQAVTRPAARAATSKQTKPATTAPAKMEVAKVARLPEKPPPPDLRAKPAVAPKEVARVAPRPVAPRKNGSGTLLERISRWYKDMSGGLTSAKAPRVAAEPAPKPVTAVAAENTATPSPVSAPVPKKPSAPPGKSTSAAAVAPPKAATATGRMVQPSAQVPEAIKRVSEQIASLPPESEGTVNIAETTLNLSARELAAFRKPNENLSGIFQRSVAVRLLLSEILSKAESDRASLAPMLKFAYSEASLLQQRIAQVKNNKDVEGALALTACSKALAALSEKIEESLTQTVPSNSA